MATRKIIEKEKPDVAVIHHGIYIPQGVISEVCKKYGVRQVVWNVGYRRGSILLSEDDTYHKVIPSITKSEIQELNLDKHHKMLGSKYVSSRWTGGSDWVRFQNKKYSTWRERMRGTKTELLILTNVAWDAQIHFENSYFGSQHEWLELMIKLCKKLNIKTKIRIHPAENLGTHPSRENLAEFLNALITKHSADSIKIIEPDDRISTYTLIDAAKAICVYGSKTSIESAVKNKPEIGRAHV